MADYETIGSEPIFQGRVFNLRRDEVRAPGGRVHKLDIVEHPGAVGMLPLDDAGQLHLVRQYRHAAGRRLLEIPAGTLEPGEDVQACAQRELREEIGMAAGELSRLADFYPAPGISTEVITLFLARELVSESADPDEDEDLQLHRLGMQQAFDLVKEGGIVDAKTIIALHLARETLGVL